MMDDSSPLEEPALKSDIATVADDLRYLELVFDDPGLVRLRTESPHHPAVERYDTTSALLERRTELLYPDETGIVLAVGELLLDRLDLAPSYLPVSIWTSLASDDDRRVIQSRCLDASQFEDQLAVFGCIGLLRSRGLPAMLNEAPGQPDIRIASVTSVNWIEVKHIRLGTSPGRVRRVLKKANSQLKQVCNGGAGVVFLRLARPSHNVAFDDTIPSQVQTYLDEVRREMGSDVSRSVAEVVVIWDDYMELGAPPDTTAYYLRRRTTLLRHQNPRSKPELGIQLSDLGRTVVLPVRWASPATPAAAHRTLSEVQAGNLKISQLFRQESEARDGIRTAHAIEAFRTPDATAEFPLGSDTFILATRRINSTISPFTLLLIASKGSDGQVVIELGFRIFDDEAPVPAWLYPLEALQLLLDRFGIPIEVGGQVGVCIVSAIVLQGSDGPIDLIKPVSGSDDDFIVHACIRKGDLHCEVSWAFAVSRTRYFADASRRRGGM